MAIIDGEQGGVTAIATATASPKAGTRVAAVLGLPDVRRLWLAGVGAGIMRWLEILAFGLYALAETSSPTLVALMSFARFLPLLLLGAPLGVLGERADRRRLLIVSFLTMALLELLLASVALFGSLRLWHLLGLAFAGGIFWCIEIPVRRTYLAETGGTERVAVSMGLEMVTTHSTRMLGPIVGGALLASTGLLGALLLGTALYAIGAALIARVEPPARPISRDHVRITTALHEGLVLIRGDGRLMAIVALTIVFNLFGLPYLGLIPILSVERLGLGPFGTGVLAAAEGLGAIMAALSILAFARPRWFGPIFGLGCLAFFITETTPGLTGSAVTAFPALLMAGVGMAGFSAMQATLPVAIVPAGMRVRVAGVILVAIGSAPFGFLLAGVLGERVGPAYGITLLGALGLATTAICLWRWPEMARPASRAAPTRD
jgi:MFS family permease